MYYIKVVDGKGNIVYQNTEVETLVEGVNILEEVFEDIEDSDNYVVEFNVVPE